MNAIYKFVLGMIGKRSGVVTTLPNQKQIEFQANMLAEKFMQNGNINAPKNNNIPALICLEKG